MNEIVEKNFCDALYRLHIAAKDEDLDCEDGTLSSVTEDGVPIRKLFVSNLAERTTYKDLSALFSRYGHVESCYLRRNYGKSNYGFVTFSSMDDAMRARRDGSRKEIRLHNRDLKVMAADSWHQPDSMENQYYNSAGKDWNKSEKKVCGEQCNHDCTYNDSLDTGIHMLNDDCLMHIFLYLPIVDRVKIERVCKRWRAISYESWCTMKKLDLSHSTWGFPPTSKHSQINTVILRKVLLRCGRFLNEINLSQISHRLSQSTLTVIGKLCPNLQSVDVTAVTVCASGINSLMSNCPNITRFSCGSYARIHDKDLSKFFKVNKKLVSFKTKACISGKCLLHLPETLEELSLERCYIEGHYLSTALAKFTKLKKLTVSKCVTITHIALEAIGAFCTHLTELEFSDYFPLIKSEDMFHITQLVNLEVLKLAKNNAVTDEFLINLSSRCQRLTYLDIQRCNSVTNTGLKALGTLPNLEKLFISYLLHITDHALNMYNLKHLECRGCSFLCDEGVCNFIENSPQLELLDLSGCIGITYETLETAVFAADSRQNTLILKIYVGGTAIKPCSFFMVSPLLQVINVDLSLPDNLNNFSNYSLVTEREYDSSISNSSVSLDELEY